MGGISSAEAGKEAMQMVTRGVVRSVILLLLPLMMSARLFASAPAGGQSTNSYTPRYHTMAHEILDIESGALPVDDSMFMLLDDILDDAKESIGSQPAPCDREGARRVLGTIDKILIKHNFVYPGKGCTVVYLRDALVAETIEPSVIRDILTQPKNRRRKPVIDISLPIHEADCDTTSFIYLGIGEILGFPMSLVEVPRHNFTRWTFSDGSHINWEANYGGVVDDQEYKRDFGVSQDQYDRGIYLQSMTREEVLGYCYTLRGYALEDRKQYSAAFADYERAMQLYGKAFWGYYAHALMLATADDRRVRDGKKAVALAKKAAAIDESAWVLDALAAAYAESGDFDKALDCEKRAWKLDPTDPIFAKLCDAYAEHKTYVQYMKEAAARGEDPQTEECPYRKAVKH